MIKAIFFDIDGTLVSFQTHRIAPAVLDALHRLQDRGVRLFLATGRHRGSIGLAADVFPFDGLITVKPAQPPASSSTRRRPSMSTPALWPASSPSS